MSLFVCHKWRGHGWKQHRVVRYHAAHVNTLASMLRRHGGHRLLCITDDPGGIDPLIEVVAMPENVAALPSYFPKLWAFSREFGQIVGERFTGIDLDTVITGNPGPLTERDGDFIIWNQAQGEPYNTSFFTLEPGARAEAWERFTLEGGLEVERKVGRPTGDQCWLGYVLGPGEKTYSQADGLIQYRPKRHRERPEPHGLAYFLCGPYDPAEEAKVSAWVADAYR